MKTSASSGALLAVALSPLKKKPLLWPPQYRASKTGGNVRREITTPGTKLQLKKRRKPAFLLGEIASGLRIHHATPEISIRLEAHLHQTR